MENQTRVRAPPVVLFGYDSSPFTQKIRLCLRLKQIPYTFVTVPSMMPRPVLSHSFSLLYRKIPVMAIGRDVYCDTSIITEALEHFFPASAGYGALYPASADGRSNRAMIRGFASYWTDRPLFRIATGLIPGSVWRTRFGLDRAELIGHKLDPDKLERKLPLNLASLDMQLSMFEPLFHEAQDKGQLWAFSTGVPSLADVSLYYQLDWAKDISAGRYIGNLTGGGTRDTDNDVISEVFSAQRYPALYRWFTAFRQYVERLPEVEKAKTENVDGALQEMRSWTGRPGTLLPTPNAVHEPLAKRNGLVPGVEVGVAPDDTGRDNRTYGTLVALSPEEVVIRPSSRDSGQEAAVEVLLHFPGLGFVVRPRGSRSRL